MRNVVKPKHWNSLTRVLNGKRILFRPNRGHFKVSMVYMDLLKKYFERKMGSVIYQSQLKSIVRKLKKEIKELPTEEKNGWIIQNFPYLHKLACISYNEELFALLEWENEKQYAADFLEKYPNFFEQLIRL